VATGDALRAQVRGDDTHLAMFDATSAAGHSFVDAVVHGTEELIDDPEFMRATDAWFRWTPREVGGHRDGPALEAAGLSPWRRVFAQLAPRPSGARYHRAWLEATRDVHLATAPAFGVISVRDPAEETQLIEAGRLWQRLHLEATLRQLAMQPLDQWLELIDRTRQRGRAAPLSGTSFAPAGFVPVMMFRAGTPQRSAQPSARRPLDDVIVS